LTTHYTRILVLILIIELKGILDVTGRRKRFVYILRITSRVDLVMSACPSG